MSVIWTLGKDYEVVDVWYGRTVIRSKYKLFYEVCMRDQCYTCFFFEFANIAYYFIILYSYNINITLISTHV